MFVAVLLLAQVAAAGSPIPSPTAVPVKYGTHPIGSTTSVAPPLELGDSAGKIKLKKGVSFDQDKAPIPPTPTPVPMPRAGALGQTPARAEVDPAVPTSAEQAWRAKYRACRDELRASKAALDAAKAANPASFGGKDTDIMKMTDEQRRQILPLSETLRNSTISPYETRYAEAQAAMASLPEDCRKAGGNPGWLRD